VFLAAAQFETFASPHLAAMAVIVSAAAALPLVVRVTRSPRLDRIVRWTIALALLANELAYYAYGLATQPADDFLRQKLPLHLCGAAVYLTTWTLIRPGQIVYELTYFWGIGGTIQAIVTPNLQVPVASYWFFQYFLCHGLIVVGAVYATFAMGWRPRRGAVLRMMILSNLYMGAIAVFDWAMGANYMFLCHPPAGDTPFFFLPWPWYILFLEAVALVTGVVLYAPWYSVDRMRNSAGGGTPVRHSVAC